MTVTERQFRGAGGIRLVGDVGGDAARPIVILLHGGGQTRHSWRGATNQFIEHGYHVINLDARGHGQSDWAADGDYSLATLARDLERVIETLPRKPALVGASMGGATALTLAGTRPDPIAAALVLVDFVPRMDRNGITKIKAFMNANPNGFASVSEAADAISAYNPHRPRPKDLSGLMKNLRHRENGRYYWHWDPRVMPSSEPLEPLARVQRLEHAAENVRIPALLIRGLESDLVTEAGVADLRRLMADLTVIDVAAAGHMVAGDKNDAFNQGVLEFLKRVLPP